MTAPAWGPETTVDAERFDHQGRDAATPLSAVIAVNSSPSDANPLFLTLQLPAGSGWDEILAAAVEVLRGQGIPEGPLTWTGETDEYTEDCGCRWSSREIAWPRPTTV